MTRRAFSNGPGAGIAAELLRCQARADAAERTAEAAKITLVLFVRQLTRERRQHDKLMQSAASTPAVPPEQRMPGANDQAGYNVQNAQREQGNVGTQHIPAGPVRRAVMLRLSSMASSPILTESPVACPFCASIACEAVQPFPNEPDWAVSCPTCGALGPPAESALAATRHWNGRKQPDSALLTGALKP